jgi:drug/metabolite transporter (DMT)-like permease
MENKTLKADFFLLVASVVWGTTFVAQRVGMDHIGPFLFTGTRFAVGALVLAPLAWMARTRSSQGATDAMGTTFPFWGCIPAGVVLFAAMNLQQIGLVYTTAGKAAFITGLYVVIVPILGLFWGQRPGLGLWIGAPLAAVGLYFLSVREGFEMAPGDGWILLCAFAWAVQVLFLGWLSPKMNSCVLAFGQSVVCAILSLVTAFFFEDIVLDHILAATGPILYGGVLSVGVGFTFQVIGQKRASPTHAAIIMQFEAVVGAFSGWVILGEVMGARAVSGALIMLTGMLSAQLWPSSAKSG